MNNNKDYTIGYKPVTPNGEIFILKEPGGEREEAPIDVNEASVGNGNWYRKKVCDPKGKKGIYRNRFIDLLKAYGMENDSEELPRCYFANICYEGKGPSIDKNSGYGSLKPMDKYNRFNDILRTFFDDLAEKTKLKEAVIFVVNDTFNCIERKEKRAGLAYSINKNEVIYQMYEDVDLKTEIAYKVYAIHHPVRCPKDVRIC